MGEEEEAKGNQGRVSGEGQEWGIGGYMGDKKDTQWRWVSQHCCKSSAGPCKLSDKLRVLKACSERAAHTDTHTLRVHHCVERKVYSCYQRDGSLLCFMAFYSYVIFSGMSHRV